MIVTHPLASEIELLLAQQLQFIPVLRNLDFLLEGAWVTAWISVVTALIGLSLGIVITLMKVLGGRLLRLAANAYIEVWRNTPLLVQLFVAFFGLPSLGVRLTPIQSTVIVFSLNAAAFFAEIVRGGLAAVPRSQYEAADALAFTRTQTFRHVVLPPAFKAALPALSNQFILIVLGTSIASVIATPELTFKAAALDVRLFRSFEIYAVLIVIYFLIAQGLIRLMGEATRRTFRTRRNVDVPQL